LSFGSPNRGFSFVYTGLQFYLLDIALNSRHIKAECIYRVKLKTIEEAKELVDEYMYFYNYERIQLKSGMTPMEKRYLI